MAARAAGNADPRLVVVWDFDQTIVSDNTDTFVFERLAPDILSDYVEPRAASPRMSWTHLMDSALELLARRAIPAEAVLQAVSETPLPADIRSAIETVHAAPHAVSAILSDANTLYIDAVLRSAGLADAFEAGIVTNPARIVPPADGVASRVSVSPFHASAAAAAAATAAQGTAPLRQCDECPANMCKGQLVERLCARYQNARFVYIGDGFNDLCPSRRLGSESIVLPRAGFALFKTLQSTTIDAQVLPWASPRQLRSTIDILVSDETSIPSRIFKIPVKLPS